MPSIWVDVKTGYPYWQQQQGEELACSDRVRCLRDLFGNESSLEDGLIAGVLADAIEEDCEDCPARGRCCAMLRARFVSVVHNWVV